MHIQAKVNLILGAISTIGLAAVCVFGDMQMHRNAVREVTNNARLMADMELASREYTATQITPLLAPRDNVHFLPQTIPFYAATESFATLRKKYPDYTYKEATLNPTNPRDRATDWQADIINHFRDNPSVQEIVGERQSSVGDVLYLSHPIRVDDHACLSCHSTPNVAPPSMIKRYGPDNGFNWQFGDVVGAQIVTVPTAIPEQLGRQTFLGMLGMIVAVFVVFLLLLNVMLRYLVIVPVGRLSGMADQISKGNTDVQDLPIRGKDEISELSASFNRMQRSLKKAMSMLEED